MDSNSALLTLVSGFALIYVEVLRPGMILPAATGTTLVALGIAAFASLSVSIPGLIFIVLALALLFAGPLTSHDVAVVVVAVMSMTSGLILLVPQPHPIAPAAAAAASGLLCPALELLLVSTLMARRNKRTD